MKAIKVLSIALLAMFTVCNG